MDKLDRIKGGIWSSIIGDALGVPVEFFSRGRLTDVPVVDFREFGTYEQPRGTWSDDSSLMLCSMENIIKNGDYDSLLKLFTKWYKYNHWTATNVCFDIGLTTRKALKNYGLGLPYDECGIADEKSNGNGSLMRILPYSYMTLQYNTVDKEKTIFESSAVTHAHIISKLSCLFYTLVIHRIMEGNSKEDSIDGTYEYIRELSFLDPSVVTAEVFDKFSRCKSDVLNKLTVNEIKSTGYVIDTLEASLYSFLKHDNIMDALYFAVNLGEDTDTVACVTGGLVGTYYGIENIPSDVFPIIQRSKDIEGLLEKFVLTINERK